jgi:hypothetical protein
VYQVGPPRLTELGVWNSAHGDLGELSFVSYTHRIKQGCKNVNNRLFSCYHMFVSFSVSFSSAMHPAVISMYTVS